MTAFQADDAGSIPAPRSSLFSVCGDKWTSTLFGTRNMSVRGRPHWPINLLFCYFWQHRAGLADKISYFARKIVGIVSVQSRLQPKLIWFYVATSYHWNVDLSGSERIWILCVQSVIGYTTGFHPVIESSILSARTSIWDGYIPTA